ncbi:serine/threonine protein kinase [Frankia sp. AiPa1]|nr:serine/threonine protein kinase [Frankia sp. AiPa1]
MGRVFLAHSPSGRLTAVKLIRPELADDEMFRDRFRREVAVARLVSGAFTAPVLDADPDAPTPWLATQYVAGPALDEAVAQNGPFSPRVLRKLGAGILEALIDVHRAGLVHRDLKPSNVLLAADGPRLIDFGIARAADHTELTRSGDLIGTAAYMSPEQASGKEAGPESDVFAFGAVLLFAATGRSPFGGGTPAAVLYRIVHGEPDLTDVPTELSEFVRSCLVKEPGDRPAPAELLNWITAGMRAAGPAWPAGVTRLLDERAAETSAQLPRTAVLPPTSPPRAAVPAPAGTPPPPARIPPPPWTPSPDRAPFPAGPPSPAGTPSEARPPASPPPGSRPGRMPAAPATPPAPPAFAAGVAVFPGRWRMFLAVGLVIVLVTGGWALWAVTAIGSALANHAVHTHEETGDELIRAGFVLIWSLLLMPLGLWRVRYGLHRPALSIGPHGIHAEVGGRHVDLGWAHIARADVIPLGRGQVLAVWPAVPGTSWALGGRRALRRPRGRYRCFRRHHALGCDIIMDVALLRASPSREIRTALGAVPRR